MSPVKPSPLAPAPGDRPSRVRPWVWPAIIVAVIVVALVMCVSAAIALFRPSAQRVHRLHMETDLVPRRAYLAEQLREEGARRRLDLVLTSKEYGSLQGLEEVNSPNEIKLGLVPGGVKDRDYPNVRQVTILTVEPLHVFVRSELAAHGLPGLRGKRVALGPPTMGSHHIAREVLAFAGLQPGPEPGPGRYTLVTESPDDLFQELRRIEPLAGAERAGALQALPDAIVFLAPTPSLLGKALAQTAGYHLLPVPFAEAFCRERLTPPNREGVSVDRSLFTPTTVPPYTYGIDPATPAQPCPTVGVPLILVAERDTDADAVVRLLEVVYDSPLANVIRPTPLRDQVAAFPLHPGTEQYLHRNDPLLSLEAAYKLGILAGGVGALISGLIALYTFMRFRKLKRFVSYYFAIDGIDQLARGLEVDPDAPTDSPSLRAHLETRLSTLKHDVLKDFAEGGLQGEGLMAGIIALINDTRDALAGMAARREIPKTVPSTDKLDG